MSDFPDFSAHGYQIIRELGRNREGGRITWLATETNRMGGGTPSSSYGHRPIITAKVNKR